MAESTLALAYNDLMGEVGFNLGFSRGTHFEGQAWSPEEQNAIEFAVRSGLRQFYDPPLLEGQATAHLWSFLRPMATLDFPSGSRLVQLPDDCAGIEGDIYLLSAKTTNTWPLRITNPGVIAQMYANVPTCTGRPMYAGIQPIKGTTALQGQRHQLSIFPQSDQDYTLQFQYYIMPDCLSGAFPYAYGLASHSETILESCLAIAEQRLDDTMGLHTAKFMQRLASSISKDRALKAQFLGRNRDNSDNIYGRDRTGPWNQYPGIRVNGVQY